MELIYVIEVHALGVSFFDARSGVSDSGATAHVVRGFR
jgi:hypothetical protein